MLMRVKITWHSPCFAPIAITAQIESCTKLGVWGVTLLIVEPNSKRAHNKIIRENLIPSPIIHLACSFSSGDRSLELKPGRKLVCVCVFLFWCLFLFRPWSFQVVDIFKPCIWGCIVGGVGIPCIYSHARWRLSQAIQDFALLCSCDVLRVQSVLLLLLLLLLKRLCWVYLQSVNYLFAHESVQAQHNL